MFRIWFGGLDELGQGLVITENCRDRRRQRSLSCSCVWAIGLEFNRGIQPCMWFRVVEQERRKIENLQVGAVNGYLSLQLSPCSGWPAGMDSQEHVQTRFGCPSYEDINNAVHTHPKLRGVCILDVIIYLLTLVIAWRFNRDSQLHRDLTRILRTFTFPCSRRRLLDLL